MSPITNYISGEEKLLYENIIASLKKENESDDNWDKLFDIINENFPSEYKSLVQLMVRRKKNENVNYINTSNPENFLTFIQEQGASSFADMPSNCDHIKISYFIWKSQGQEARDPTDLGRKIKRAHLIVA